MGFAVGAMVGVAVGVAEGFVILVAVAVGIIVGFVVEVAVGFAVGTAVGFVILVAVAVGFNVGSVVAVAIGSLVEFAEEFVLLVAMEVTVAVAVAGSAVVIFLVGLLVSGKELSLSSGAFFAKTMHKTIIMIVNKSPRSASKIHGNGFFFAVAAGNTVFSSNDFIQYRQNCALSVNSDLQ